MHPSIAVDFLTPALVVDLDAVRGNIARLIDYAGGDCARLRPHLKTTKMPRVWREMLDAGIRSFKCATTREAAVFATLINTLEREGVDLLVAYPHRAPALAALAATAAATPGLHISVAIEDEALLDDWPSQLGVFIDINPGMNRTGIPKDDDRVIKSLASRAGDRLRGLHFYDGHIRDGSVESRRSAAHAGYRHVAELAGDLLNDGLVLHECVTSGTPTFLHALAFDWESALPMCTHRVSPGTVVFHDFGYADMLPELDFAFAATVASRVVSHPSADRFTCDAGSKAIAAEAGDPCARIVDLPAATAEKPSEEHLPFHVDGPDRPARGSIVSLLPRHICPTVNLHDEAIIIEAGEVTGTAPIAARGHDLHPATTVYSGTAGPAD